MASISLYHLIVVATALVWMLFIGKGACQNLSCPNGITDIKAVSGQIAYPGSSNDYGVNETKCWRIQVPEVYGWIGIYFHVLDIEQCDDCKCDSLTFSYNDTSGGWGGGGGAQWKDDAKCGRQTAAYLAYLRHVDGDPHEKYQTNELYVRFASDGNVNYKGFNLTFIAKTDPSGSVSFLNASEGETIEFGTPKYGIVNYTADYAEQWFLIVPGGRRIQITFEAFELEQSENCKNAYVEIREAYFDDGPTEHDIEVDYGVILAERMCGSSLPKQIQSSADMAWVQFKSTKNSATTYKGFKASFKAIGEAGPGPGNQTSQCCDCKCNNDNNKSSGQGRLSTSNPLMLLFISALLMIGSKGSLF